MAKTLSVNLERALRSSGSGKGVAGLQKEVKWRRASSVRMRNSDWH